MNLIKELLNCLKKNLEMKRWLHVTVHFTIFVRENRILRDIM